MTTSGETTVLPGAGRVDEPRTIVVQRRDAADLPPQQKVDVGWSTNDRLTLLGAAAAGLGIGLLASVGLHLITLGWMPLVSYLWFVGVYTLLTSLTEQRPAVVSSFWTILLWSAGLVVVATLGIIIAYTATRGGSVYTHANFFTQDMRTAGPLAPLDRGGILYALVGTVEQITIALVITVPLALLTAVFLNEVGGRFARFVRTIVEAMTALPSVVAGLFVYAAVVVGITKDLNGFAASLAITILMMPIMIRSADVVLRLVPGNLREAGLALGATQWSVVRKVVLPTVRSGLTTAIILGTAHGIGETAPVLLTSGVTTNLNWDPFHNAQTSLPLAALEFIKAPQPAMKARGFATATFLLFVVLVLFLTARVVGGQEAGKLSERQLRARRRASTRVAQRMDRHRTSRAAAHRSSTAVDHAGPAGTRPSTSPSRKDPR